MRSADVIKGIKQGRSDGKSFVKWWRIENDFTDYELATSFIEHAESGHEIAGYELLDNEQMWEVLKRFKPHGLRRVQSRSGEKIEWQKRDTGGGVHTETCAFTPEAIMYIFDYETGGDVVGL